MNADRLSRLSYRAYGELEAIQNSGAAGPRRWGGRNGGFTDEMTGLVLFGARWYAPKLGRWLTPDPIGQEGGLNLYAYCDNDPVNKVDPDGLKVELIGTAAEKQYLTRRILNVWFSGSESAREVVKEIYTSSDLYRFKVGKVSTGNWRSRIIQLAATNFSPRVAKYRKGVGFFPSVVSQILLSIAMNQSRATDGQIPARLWNLTENSSRDFNLTVLHEIGHVMHARGDDDVPGMGPKNRMKNVIGSEWRYQSERGLPLRLYY